jgi:hypothetical protein
MLCEEASESDVLAAIATAQQEVHALRIQTQALTQTIDRDAILITALEKERKDIRQVFVQLHASVEQDEEYKSNLLLKKISALEDEKHSLEQKGRFELNIIILYLRATLVLWVGYCE